MVGGGGCYKLFLLDNQPEHPRSLSFPLNNRSFERENIADCANICQEISLTISQAWTLHDPGSEY